MFRSKSFARIHEGVFLEHKANVKLEFRYKLDWEIFHTFAVRHLFALNLKLPEIKKNAMK